MAWMITTKVCGAVIQQCLETQQVLLEQMSVGKTSSSKFTATIAVGILIHRLQIMT